MYLVAESCDSVRSLTHLEKATQYIITGIALRILPCSSLLFAKPASSEDKDNQEEPSTEPST